MNPKYIRHWKRILLTKLHESERRHGTSVVPETEPFMAAIIHEGAFIDSKSPREEIESA